MVATAINPPIARSADPLIPADLSQDPEIVLLLERANASLGVLGYTEHGARHAKVVGRFARHLLDGTGHSPRMGELVEIAGILHDLGNVINRTNHAENGALLAWQLLHARGMEPAEIIEIVTAIGNHHEADGSPVTPMAAALILGDKADVHHSRVRSTAEITTDIHDRVNYAARSSRIRVDNGKTILLEITIDTAISPVMEYFEIFMSRMTISRRAAESLGCRFHLVINGDRIG